MYLVRFAFMTQETTAIRKTSQLLAFLNKTIVRLVLLVYVSVISKLVRTINKEFAL